MLVIMKIILTACQQFLSDVCHMVLCDVDFELILITVSYHLFLFRRCPIFAAKNVFFWQNCVHFNILDS